jgi:hypothetical protein
LIRRARNILVAAGSAAILAGGMTLAGAGAASAQSLPTCPGTHCSTNAEGVAGYYGAEDGQTHYRYVQTVTTAAPTLVNLNGELASGPGAVGVELCDPNTGIAAQLGLVWTGTAFEAIYLVGRFGPFSAADPCIQNGVLTHVFKAGIPLLANGISPGDQISLAIFYSPSGRIRHTLSFGVCDITANVCRNATTSSRYNLNFWEFGIGAAANDVVLTAPPLNTLDSFANNMVTCYSCTHQVPITSVVPVASFGVGGLTQAQWANTSSQVVMSPNNSLSAGNTFTLFNGSTSP